MTHAMLRLAVLGLLAGCASRPWVVASPASLDRTPPVDAALMNLRDGTSVTFIAPRRDGARIVALRVAGCAGSWCPAIYARGEVPVDAVAAMGVWPARPPPAVRVDFEQAFPLALVPINANVDPVLGVGVGVRAASRMGLGGLVRFAGAGHLGTDYGSVEAAHAEGWLLDLAALYRLRPLGDDRIGLGVELSAGFSVANLVREIGHGAYADPCASLALFSSNCNRVLVTPYEAPPAAFSSGMRLGPSLGVSVDVRYEALVVGVGATYRALVYDDFRRIAEEPAALSVLTVAGFVGVGFAR